MAEHSVLIEKHAIETEMLLENELKYIPWSSMFIHWYFFSSIVRYADYCIFSHIHLWFPRLRIFRLPLSSLLDFIDGNSIKIFVDINARVRVCTRNEYLCVDRVLCSFNSHFDFICMHRCHRFPSLHILLCDGIQSMYSAHSALNFHF